MDDAQRQPQVIEQIKRLEVALSLVQENITNLALKIEPILSLSASKNDIEQKPDQKCKLAMSLETLADQAQGAYCRLQDIASRVEV